jgi:hypothetical protein
MYIIQIFILSLLFCTCVTKESSLPDLSSFSIQGVKGFFTQYPINSTGNKMPRGTDSNVMTPFEIQELSIAINLPSDLYVITRDKYTEGVESINFRIANENIFEWFTKNNIYLFGTIDFDNATNHNNDLIQIVIVTMRKNKTVISELDDDVTSLVYSIETEYENYGRSYKYFSNFEDNGMRFFKFSRVKSDDWEIFSNLYVTTRMDMEIIIEILINPAKLNEFNKHEMEIFKEMQITTSN